MKSRIIMLAVLLAMLVTLSVSLGANAASPALSSAASKGQTQTIKLLRTVNLRDAIARSTTRTPSNRLVQNIRRTIPGGAHAPAAFNTPVVPGQPILGNTGGARVAKGLNAYDNTYTNGFNLTPPDQGLCVGGGFVIETLNDVMAIYNSNLARETANATLNNFYGVDPARNLSDPRCYFDPASRRFFMTVVDYAFPDPTATPPFLGDSFIDVAVSKTSDPRLSWIIYQLDTTFPNDPGGPQIADYPMLGANRDTIVVSVNSFPWNVNSFNGAYIFAFDKMAMVAGVLFLNVEIFKPQDTPAGTCDPATGFPCWFGVQPASSPATASWNNRFGGTEYFLSNLDFDNNGANGIAAWALTNTESIRGIPDMTLTWTVVPSKVYVIPPDGVQKNDGILDTGQFYLGWNPADGAGAIASNDDEMRQTVYAADTIWGELATGVIEPYRTRETHAGLLWFAVTPRWDARGNFVPTMKRQGYVAAAHADLFFPSIGMNQAGRGVMAFSISSANMYPSAGYLKLGNTLGPGPISMYARGMGSLDDFCEYPASGCGGPGLARPRFGDYSAAFASGNAVYFANEYVQSPECALNVFTVDHTCGGTRANATNWGTSLGRLTP